MGSKVGTVGLTRPARSSRRAISDGLQMSDLALRDLGVRVHASLKDKRKHQGFVQRRLAFEAILRTIRLFPKQAASFGVLLEKAFKIAGGISHSANAAEQNRRMWSSLGLVVLPGGTIYRPAPGSIATQMGEIQHSKFRVTAARILRQEIEKVFRFRFGDMSTQYLSLPISMVDGEDGDLLFAKYIMRNENGHVEFRECISGLFQAAVKGKLEDDKVRTLVILYQELLSEAEAGVRVVAKPRHSPVHRLYNQTKEQIIQLNRELKKTRQSLAGEHLRSKEKARLLVKQDELITKIERLEEINEEEEDTPENLKVDYFQNFNRRVTNDGSDVTQRGFWKRDKPTAFELSDAVLDPLDDNTRFFKRAKGLRVLRVRANKLKRLPGGWFEVLLPFGLEKPIREEPIQRRVNQFSVLDRIGEKRVLSKREVALLLNRAGIEKNPGPMLPRDFPSAFEFSGESGDGIDLVFCVSYEDGSTEFLQTNVIRTSPDVSESHDVEWYLCLIFIDRFQSHLADAYNLNALVVDARCDRLYVYHLVEMKTWCVSFSPRSELNGDHGEWTNDDDHPNSLDWLIFPVGGLFFATNYLNLLIPSFSFILSNLVLAAASFEASLKMYRSQPAFAALFRWFSVWLLILSSLTMLPNVLLFVGHGVISVCAVNIAYKLHFREHMAKQRIVDRVVGRLDAMIDLLMLSVKRDPMDPMDFLRSCEGVRFVKKKEPFGTSHWLMIRGVEEYYFYQGVTGFPPQSYFYNYVDVIQRAEANGDEIVPILIAWYTIVHGGWTWCNDLGLRIEVQLNGANGEHTGLDDMPPKMVIPRPRRMNQGAQPPVAAVIAAVNNIGGPVVAPPVVPIAPVVAAPPAGGPAAPAADPPVNVPPHLAGAIPGQVLSFASYDKNGCVIVPTGGLNRVMLDYLRNHVMPIRRGGFPYMRLFRVFYVIICLLLCLIHVAFIALLPLVWFRKFAVQDFEPVDALGRPRLLADKVDRGVFLWRVELYALAAAVPNIDVRVPNSRQVSLKYQEHRVRCVVRCLYVGSRMTRFFTFWRTFDECVLADFDFDLRWAMNNYRYQSAGILATIDTSKRAASFDHSGNFDGPRDPESCSWYFHAVAAQALSNSPQTCLNF